MGRFLFALLIIQQIFVLGTFLPALAVTVRRLHDTGKSGWWILFGMVPLGIFVLMAFLVQDSLGRTNRHGLDPKEHD